MLRKLFINVLLAASAALATALVLTACGGSGGGGTAPPPDDTCPTKDWTITITESACKGTTRTLTAGVSGADAVGPYTYQWQKDGVNLAGKTSATLDVEGGTGSYSCVVTDTDDDCIKESLGFTAGTCDAGTACGSISTSCAGGPVYTGCTNTKSPDPCGTGSKALTGANGSYQPDEVNGGFIVTFGAVSFHITDSAKGTYTLANGATNAENIGKFNGGTTANTCASVATTGGTFVICDNTTGNISGSWSMVVAGANCKSISKVDSTSGTFTCIPLFDVTVGAAGCVMTATPSGGKAPYSYSGGWTPAGDTLTATQTGTTGTTYTVTVTDSNGATTTTTFDLTC